LHLAWSGSGGDHPRIAGSIERLGLGERTFLTQGRIDVPSFLAGLDVFVLPYRSVTRTRIIPSVLLEVLAVGVPLVVTRCLPIEDVVEHGKTAVVVERDDVGAIGDSVVRLLEHPAQAREMSQAQRAVARATFSQQAVGQAFVAMFHSVLSMTAPTKKAASLLAR
jgi:glycosyltransferase involved in cell wall biosynthesis